MQLIRQALLLSKLIESQTEFVFPCIRFYLFDQSLNEPFSRFDDFFYHFWIAALDQNLMVAMNIIDAACTYLSINLNTDLRLLSITTEPKNTFNCPLLTVFFANKNWSIHITYKNDVQIWVIRLQYKTQNENHRMDVTPLEGMLQSAKPMYIKQNKVNIWKTKKFHFKLTWPTMKSEVVTHRFLVSVTSFRSWNAELHASTAQYNQARQCSHDGNILPAVLNSFHCQSYLIT